MISSVVFDVGETLLDDTHESPPGPTGSAYPTHLLRRPRRRHRPRQEQRRHVHLLTPDLDTERARREAAGHGEQITDTDLYPDVRPALTTLRAHGIWVGIAGNQTTRAAHLLRALALPADAIATSGEWCVATPTPHSSTTSRPSPLVTETRSCTPVTTATTTSSPRTKPGTAPP